MTEPSQEFLKSLEDRIEREPQSPLFARLAAYYLSSGRAKDALRLCDNGLALYPFYSTAHLVKGRALVELGMLAEAKHEYEVVLELLPTNTTAARLWSSIDLGTPAEIHPASLRAEPAYVAEVTVEPEPIPVPQPEPVFTPEEPVIEEPTAPVAEEAPLEMSAPSEVLETPEEPVAPEPVAEEAPLSEQPEATPVAEDAFGVPIESPVAEEPSFGAAEKLGMTMGEESSPAAMEPGFGAVAEEPHQAAEEMQFGEQPAEQPQAVTEDPFALAPEAPAEPPAIEVPAAEPAAAEQPADWFDAFSQLQQPTEQQAETPAPAQAEEENPFAAFGADQPSATVDAESYEDFTARVRMELFGTENSLTLEEYLSQQSSAPGITGAPDHIDALTEKLKSSQRITPPVINFAEKTKRSPDDVDETAGTGIVTPTLAEIYVKQGWYDDAIKAYQNLASSKPEEKEKYELRIAEIEEMRRGSK